MTTSKTYPFARELHDWYSRQIALQRKRVRWMFFGLVLTTAFWFAQFVFLINLGDATDRTKFQDAALLYIAIGIGLIAVICGFALVRSLLSSPSTMLDKIVPFPDDRLPQVTSKISQLANEMQIDLRRLTLWYGCSNDAVPSIVESRRKIHLVLPRFIIVLANRCPNQFEALIAHEFGHIKQRDSRVWLYVHYLVTPMVFCQGINLIASIVITLLVAGTIPPLALPYSAGLCWTRFKSAEILHDSEILADSAAMVFADGHALLDHLSSMPVYAGGPLRRIGEENASNGSGLVRNLLGAVLPRDPYPSRTTRRAILEDRLSRKNELYWVRDDMEV